MKMDFCNKCLFAIKLTTITIYILHNDFKFFNHFSICILTLLLHAYDLTNH